MKYELPANWSDPVNTMRYLSHSQIKNFEECPSRELARQRGDYKPEDKEAFFIGRYVDVALTEPDKFKDFCLKNRERIFKDPTLKSVQEVAKAKGYDKPPKKTDDLPEFFKRYPHLKDELSEKYAKVAEAAGMIKAAQEDPQMRAILQGEGQVRMVGEVAGVPVRGILDVLNEDMERFVDLKTAKDFETSWSQALRRRIPWYLGWRYDRQMALYQHMVFQNTGVVMTPVIAALSKQTPPDREIIAFEDPDAMERAYNELEELVPHIQAWKAGEEFHLGHAGERLDLDAEVMPGEVKIHFACGRCDYCRATKKTKILVAESYE